MPHSNDPEADLRKVVGEGRAAIVVGTGVSIAASMDPKTGKPHPEASWVGLLKNGLRWMISKDIQAKAASLHLDLLDQQPKTIQLIASAQVVLDGMGRDTKEGSNVVDWLKRTVGSIKAHDRTALVALEALRCRGNLLATTNYDDLLLGGKKGLGVAAWNGEKFLGAARGDVKDTILFLHGYWQQPNSVILDWDSYSQITRDEKYRDYLKSFWTMTTWVYVGCGLDGLNDPDIGLLLARYGRDAREAGHLDYCLVRESERVKFESYFETHHLNISAVSYGDKHADLPKFLQSLLPSPPETTTIPVALPIIENEGIPTPPALYSEPAYIGSHTFVGRDAQLQELSDWAKPADPTNLLLFEAIGGNGKSMLTWEWVTNPALAPAARPASDPWAGIFWYSFYERGAIMADFCRRALAYMTGRPLKEFEKKKTVEMAKDLLTLLHAKPWLLILDGLERVLVAYHRIDAAEVADEEVNIPTDKIVDRNPCDAIRDEDNELLRALAAAKPSKILVSSRLTPRVLLNPANQEIQGVKRRALPGLRPPDAEALLRSCGVSGDSTAIQTYLTTNCDNHPLVVGIIGGLVVNYKPDRGNFDAWLKDKLGGATLNWADLPIIQRRNHILRAAFEALPPHGQALLSTIALINESVDYATFAAFNPHLPPEIEEVEKPDPPGDHWRWDRMTDEQKEERQQRYQSEFGLWESYQKAVKERIASTQYKSAPGKLHATIDDLERRGLLQWDGRDKKYNLHPVVRNVAAAGMKAEDKERHGQRVVDHFMAQPHRPYEQAETMEDVRSGLHVVRTLLKLGRFQ